MKIIIKQVEKLTLQIKNYFSVNLYNIETCSPENKLYICYKSSNIIGSFFINKKYQVVKEIFIVEHERNKGYCKIILDYLKKHFVNLYFDVYYNNIPANKCYSKYLSFDSYLPSNEFYLIYGYKPPVPIIRYRLSK
jgi:hypothetical protein